MPNAPRFRYQALSLLLTVTAFVAIFVACGAREDPPLVTVAPTETAVAPTATAVPPTVEPGPTTTPRPSPTPMPMLPTQTPAPRPSPTPFPAVQRPPPIPSGFTDEVYAVLQALVEDHSPRESATGQELAAAQYLGQRLSALGYETLIQDFTVDQMMASVELTSPTIDVPDATESLPISGSLEGISTGLLADVGHAFEDDIPAEGLNGLIALIERGTITFEAKVEHVADAGAIGAIVFNNESGNFRGRFANPSSIPAVAVSQADGRALLDYIEVGEVAATVSVGLSAAPSRNVVADLPGRPGTVRTVILGAHYDTVADTQGASDNTSGVSTVLTMAKHIADRQYPFNIRIVLFGSEELGLFGSRHYVDNMSQEQIDNTLAMLNFDAFGTGTTLAVAGDDEFTAEAQRIGQDLGLDILSEGPGQGMSDHAAFQAVDIPVLFLLSNDLSRINSPEDEIQYINPNLLGYAAEIGMALLEWLATGTEA